MSTAAPVRLTTTTQSTPPAFAIAASTLAFNGTFLPPRSPSSAVMMTLDWQAVIRWARLSGEKPANTTEWMAPMRAQARIAEAASGVIGGGEGAGSALLAVRGV